MGIASDNRYRQGDAAIFSKDGAIVVRRFNQRTDVDWLFINLPLRKIQFRRREKIGDKARKSIKRRRRDVNRVSMFDLIPASSARVRVAIRGGAFQNGKIAI